MSASPPMVRKHDKHETIWTKEDAGDESLII